jgi:hypothetical protein
LRHLCPIGAFGVGIKQSANRWPGALGHKGLSRPPLGLDPQPGDRVAA